MEKLSTTLTTLVAFLICLIPGGWPIGVGWTNLDHISQVFILEVMTKQIIKKYDVKYMTHVFHYLGGKLTVAADKFDLHIILCTRGNTYKVLKQTGRLRASV